MRSVIAGLVALASAAVLSSCALLPFGLSSEKRHAEDRMEQIADAVDDHDAAALKAMFSDRALEQATHIDDGIDYFLSFFPDGGLTWERQPSSSEGSKSQGTELVNSHFKVTAGGVDYSLFFADYTVNAIDPDNVGIYGLGVTAWTDDRGGGASEPFFYWAGSFRMNLSDASEDAYPGVFVGYDNSRLSLHKMTQLVDEVNSGDVLGLKEDVFTEYAQAADAAEIDTGIAELYALFPDGDVVWQQNLPVEPTVRHGADGGETTLLLSTYPVTAGSGEFWLCFAYFTQNAMNPDNVGVYAIGAAPRTASGDSPAEQALFAWADSIDVDASVAPGVFVPE